MSEQQPAKTENVKNLGKVSETFESHLKVRHIKEITSYANLNFQYVLPWESCQTLMKLNKTNQATVAYTYKIARQNRPTILKKKETEKVLSP